MSFRLYLLSGLLMAGLPLSAFAATPVWRGDLETGDLTQWSSKLDAQPYTTDRLVVVPSPSAQGLFAMKVTVKPGDLDNNGNRAEVVLRERMFHQGDEVWFHWYTLFPSDFRVTSKWALFTQWHSGNPYGVPLGFNLHGTRMSMRVMGHEYDAASNWNGGILWTEQLQPGKWMEFLVRVKWSDGNDGFIEVWKDRKLVVPKTFHRTLDPGDYVYLKQGFYRNATIDYNQTIYHDGMTLYEEEPTHLLVPEPDPLPDDPPDAGDDNPPDPKGPADAGSGDAPDAGSDGGTDPGTPSDGDGGLILPDPPDYGWPPSDDPPKMGCAVGAAAPLGAGLFLVLAGLRLLHFRRRARRAA